jgi:hypothetical protein
LNLLYPSLSRHHLPLMLRMAVMGALIAGIYGILHDQVTYTISPEYFTDFKSEQFAWANFGWPIRVFVAEIGFLATWGVGFVAGWFLARLTVPHLPRAEALKRCYLGFGIVFAFALLGGLVGAGWGWSRMQDGDLGGWTSFARLYGVKDVRHFVWVAFIHNCSYGGGFVGLIAALLHARMTRKLIPAGGTVPPVDGGDNEASAP